MLHWAGVERVLNLVEDEEYRPQEREALERAFAQMGIEEHRLPFPDFGGLPSELVDRAVSIISGWLGEGRRIYVHCRAGVNRSATVVAAYLMWRDRLTRDEALKLIRSKRRRIMPFPAYQEYLSAWEKSLK